MRRNRSSRFGGKRIGFALGAEIRAGIFGVNFEEVVEDDQEHGGATEEDGEGVELGVGDHGCCVVGFLGLDRWVLVEKLLGFICHKRSWKVDDRLTFGMVP